jgi:hypothetical protein
VTPFVDVFWVSSWLTFKIDRGKTPWSIVCGSARVLERHVIDGLAKVANEHHLSPLPLQYLAA